ncbi:MAG: molybdopterin-dependent oxidoreductase [Burkholderiaceae bacterium]
MPRPTPDRRRFIAGVAGLMGAWCFAPARAGTPAARAVILTVSGNRAHGADKGLADFDLARLQSLPTHSFSTRTPWYPQPRRFTGVLVSDLLEAAGVRGTSLSAAALNDYRVEIPVDDLTRNGAVIAYLLDDKPMAVRDKGPLVIIYPFDNQPELRDAIHYSRAVWQLRTLELR